MAKMKGSTVRPIVLSPSKIAEWATCRRRYELRYIENWEPPTDSPSMVVGAAIHRGLAIKAKGGALEDVLGAASAEIGTARLELDEKLACLAKAKAVLRSWRARPGWTVEAVELRIDTKVPRSQRLVVGGIVDMILVSDEGQRIVADHKVSSRQHSAEYAAIDLQLLAYYSILQKLKENVVGSAWCSIVLPGTKMHVDETSSEYEERLVRLYEENPERYFQFYPITYTSAHTEYFWNVCRSVAKEVREGRIYRNPKACQYMGCAYHSVCINSHHAAVMGFVKGGVDVESDVTDAANGE